VGSLLVAGSGRALLHHASPLSLVFAAKDPFSDPDPFRVLPAAFGFLAVALLVARLITAHYYVPWHWAIHQFPTHLRIDSLFFGVVISYYTHFHGEKFSRFVHTFFWPLTTVGIALVAPCFFMEQSQLWMYTYGLAALYLGFGALLIVFLHVPVESAWIPVSGALRAFAYVGTFSYSIYLWHVFWMRFLQGLNVTGIPYIGLFLYYSGAIIWGILISKLIEIPTLRLRDRLYPALVPLVLEEQTPTQFSSENLAVT
jgi:peptidoglycan/LPS O-acetylase OafA/YrhL